MSLEIQTLTNEATIAVLRQNLTHVNVCYISLAQEKKKTFGYLFFEIYKIILIIFTSENCSYTGDPPNMNIFMRLSTSKSIHVRKIYLSSLGKPELT